jgi:N-carbamoyl-L-amino-acid hydrolase
MATIDPGRLLADLRRLRTFGAEGNGVVRPSLSPIDMDARRWLRGRMAEAGLEARIDGVGTVYGRSPRPGKALVIGSHSDTQPRGGWLDGALGVIYALEVARALAEDPETRDLPVDIGAWMDEEGTYLGFLGSRSFCGDLNRASIEAATNRAGEPLTAAIRAAGLADEACAAIEPERHFAYLEAHIEQGPYLEASGNRIGVVTAIVGLRTARIVFSGVQNHAGTTPMPLRKDAGVALVAFANRVQEEFRALAGERTSIIPGRAEMYLQFRDPELAVLDRLEAKMRALVAEADERGPVAVEAEMMGESVTPMAMDEGLQAHMAAAAERHAPGAWMRMPSGAAHDAQIFALRLPAFMLFVPSIGGISHDFAEDTAEADIVLGCQILATAAGAILRQAAAGS